jgi:HAD superfamily hydrolase (TIGR01509 family)
MQNTLLPKAVLWDMDGTLVDTHEAHYQTWVDALAKHGVVIDRVQFAPLYGLSSQTIMESILGRDVPPELVKQVSEEKEAVYREGLRGNLTLLPGVPDWLARFSAAGIPQAVASSGPMENIRAVLHETHISHFFNEVCSSVGHPGKPDPWVFLEACRRLGVLPADALVIEDSAHGIQAANRAGCRCIGVSNQLTMQVAASASLVVANLALLNQEQVNNIFTN